MSTKAISVLGHDRPGTIAEATSHHGTFVLCNAVVVEASRNEKAREGCTSVPDLTGDVQRALQHEIDHCDGLLFLDRAAGAHAIHPRKTSL